MKCHTDRDSCHFIFNTCLYFNMFNFDLTFLIEFMYCTNVCVITQLSNKMAELADEVSHIRARLKHVSTKVTRSDGKQVRQLSHFTRVDSTQYCATTSKEYMVYQIVGYSTIVELI